MREIRDELSLSVFLRRPERQRTPGRVPRGAQRRLAGPRRMAAWEAGGAGGLSPGSGARGQRCTVKVGYLRAGTRGEWRAHGVYLAREGAQREGAKGLGFDAAREDVDVAGTLGAWQAAGDQILWKAIVSPEQAARLDLRAHARALVAAMERDLGTRLAWVGIDHHNTDNPHLHLLIRGRDARGRPLTLDAPYVQQGIRARSEDLATRALGWRSHRQITASQERLVDRARFTDLDRALLARADGDGRVVCGGRGPAPPRPGGPSRCGGWNSSARSGSPRASAPGAGSSVRRSNPPCGSSSWRATSRRAAPGTGPPWRIPRGRWSSPASPRTSASRAGS